MTRAIVEISPEALRLRSTAWTMNAMTQTGRKMDKRFASEAFRLPGWMMPDTTIPAKIGL